MIRQVSTRNCFLGARKQITSTVENPGQMLQTAGTVIADMSLSWTKHWKAWHETSLQ